MRHFNKNINNKMATILANRILNGINSILIDYSFLFSEEELKLLIFNRELLNNDLQNERLSIEELLRQISILEETLKPLSFKCWEYEANKGSSYIFWLKNGNYHRGSKVISSTFSNNVENPFCNAEIGVKYAVNFNAFIAACEKDAACIRESSDKASLYTIRELPNGEVINSYNLATPIITPKQIASFNENEYMSKHNEIILDVKYIKPISVVCLTNTYKEVAEDLSVNLDIPIEFINKVK